MAREDLITKNDANYIINCAIEKENNEAFLETLGRIKDEISNLIPAKPKPLTPCERDGHNYKSAHKYSDWGTTYATLYCRKCGEVKTIKVGK